MLTQCFGWIFKRILSAFKFLGKFVVVEITNGY